MRRIGVVAVAAIVGFGATLALAEPPAPAPAWQGAYAGIFAGNDLTALRFNVPGEFQFNGVSGETQMGGALLGFNHRFGARWVGGAEIDAAIATGGTHIDVTDGSDTLGVSVLPMWGGSLKGRYGYLASPDTLFYATAGAVVAVANYGCEISTVDGCPDRMQKTLYGWPLMGVGAETRIGPNWRFRYEYDVKFLPTLDFEGVEVTPLSGTANIALIRDLGGKETMSDATFGFAPKTWTGFYAGLAAGHQMSSTSFTGDFEGVQWLFNGFGAGSVTGGGFAGYLQQAGPLVFGVEAGNYWNAGDLSATIASYGGFSVTGNDYYDVRGRAGVIVTPSTMLYALAGWLHADGQLSVHESDDTIIDAGGFGRDGYEFGGGIETWIRPNVSLRAEYSYATFNNGIADIPEDEVQVKSHVGTATVAAVYHFGQ